MKIIMDASLPPRWAEALHAILRPEHDVTSTRALFGQDDDDRHLTAWINEQKDAIIVSLDLDISNQPHRVAAIKDRNATTMLFGETWLKLKPMTQMWMLIHRLPDILNKATRAPRTCWVVPPVHEGRLRKIS